jgi:hypothetical protein
MTVRDEVSIAGVAWPVYKLIALAAGFLVLALVAVVTGSVEPAVVAGAAAGTLTWLGLGLFQQSR